MDNSEALKVINGYKSKGMKQSEIAKLLDISDSALSQFMSGAYKTPNTIIEKIERLAGVEARREVAPKEPGFVMTSISRTVINLISYCHIQGKVGVVYGDAGVGKTMGIREYKRLNPDSAIVITVSPCFATMTGVNELLAEALKIREKMSRRIYSEAVHKLKGSRRVIIIDEAQHLTTRVINHLRCISDESGVGMAFVGNEEIYMKMRGSGQAAYAQLYSRIADKKHVLTGSITFDDISLLFGSIDKPALDVLYKISKTNYGIRGAVNVYVNTAAACGEVTAKAVAAIAREMSIVG